MNCVCGGGGQVLGKIFRSRLRRSQVLRRYGRFCATMDTSEAIFAFLSRFYANLSQFEDYCRLFEEFCERLWRERENLAIFALVLGQKLPV